MTAADPGARRSVQSGSPYEATIGFARAVRVGTRILVSGTAPVEEDGTSTPGDAEAQADRCLAIIVAAIEALGGSARDVVRTRMLLIDPADGEAVGRAHGRVFAAIRPASTMVAVQALLRPEWRVEIEAEAELGSSSGDGALVGR
ncbi:RidA family protein [Sphingomonas baiyangensis]|uniref:RidA family protein n=1 Tax=Sphingomonas baiyangensis TaxID=2572576 RepID=A0A4U1L4Y4_9SPHN|nr:RidA family protein [Sphingomonas baiyangensis]TKD51246.1 RidA family protein [Sphingomonas baiyangensis]